MSNRNKPHRGNARGARSHRKPTDLFELALRGENVENPSAFDPRTDRKTLQLCRQVQRALMLALAGEVGDELLEVCVDSVEPAGGAGHLLVRVSVPTSVSVTEISDVLNSRSAKLRAIVAGSICRKRVPMLSFLAVPQISQMNGGEHA